MRFIRLSILLFCVWLFTPFVSFCQPVIKITSLVEKQQPLGKYLNTLNDPKGRLTIQQILSSNDSFRFNKVKSDIPVFAHTNSYVWVRFNILNQTDKDLWLTIRNPVTDTIKFYAVSDNHIIASKLSGDKVPFGFRDIKSNRILFKIDNKPGLQTIYLRFNIRLPRQFPLYITTSTGFMEQGSISFFLNGIFYGLLALIVLYNLFVWLAVKDHSYLLYVIYIIFSGVVMLHFDGFTYAYLWPKHPEINDHPAILSSLSILAAALFVSRFLSLHKNYPVLQKGLVILSAGFIAACIISLAGHKFLALTISQTLAFVASFYFLLVGMLMYQKGYKPARYYMAGWSVLIACVLVFLAKDMAWISYNAFTANSLKFGISTEAILMAFALADRINFYKAGQKRAELAKLAIEQELQNAESALLQYTTNLRQKNEMIIQFKQELYELKKQLINSESEKERSEYLEKLMQSIILTSEDWIEFRKLFDKVHTGYISRLKERYPILTETDIRLLSLMKLNLSPYEMASILNVTTEAVRKAKQRLRKKINLKEQEKIEELVASV